MATEPSRPTTSSSSSTRTRPGSRDTGFPEPLCGQRNTTLPHPDADLSPNASLSFESLDSERALQRTRLSFLAKKSRTLSHGKITDGSYNGGALTRSETDQSHTDLEGVKEEPDTRPSGSTDSLHSQEPSSPTTAHRKRRNVLRKFWASK